MERTNEKAVIREFFRQLFIQKNDSDTKENTSKENKPSEDQMKIIRNANYFYHSKIEKE